MEKQRSEKLWVVPTEAELLCPFTNPRLGFGIKRPIYTDQHSLCQILILDLSWRRSRRQNLGARSLFAALTWGKELPQAGGWSWVLVSCWNPQGWCKGTGHTHPPPHPQHNRRVLFKPQLNPCQRSLPRCGTNSYKCRALHKSPSEERNLLCFPRE